MQNFAVLNQIAFSVWVLGEKSCKLLKWSKWQKTWSFIFSPSREIEKFTARLKLTVWERKQSRDKLSFTQLSTARPLASPSGSPRTTIFLSPFPFYLNTPQLCWVPLLGQVLSSVISKVLNLGIWHHWLVKNIKFIFLCCVFATSTLKETSFEHSYFRPGLGHGWRQTSLWDTSSSRLKEVIRKLLEWLS